MSVLRQNTSKRVNSGKASKKGTKREEEEETAKSQHITHIASDQDVLCSVTEISNALKKSH